jgi:large subunit ribosomal protein L5
MKNCFYIFNNKNVKFHLINKFLYKNTKELPNLKKIDLTFNSTKTELKTAATCSLALEAITAQKSCVLSSKTTNAYLKTRKGQPLGAKTSLRKKQKNIFAQKLIFDIFSKTKNFKKSYIKKFNSNALSFRNLNNFDFLELENHFNIFQKLPNLSITYNTSANNKIETAFILNFHKVPLLLI